MTRYVQPVPTPDDPYTTDPLLRSWLDRHLGPAGHAAAKGRLADLAADVSGPLRAAHADAEAQRAVTREDAGAPLLRRLAAAVDLARPLSPVLADTLAAVTTELRDRLGEVSADPAAVEVVAGARGLALRAAYALTAALLVEHAAWGDEQAEVAAQLWARRRLRHEDIAADAHRHLELLC